MIILATLTFIVAFATSNVDIGIEAVVGSGADELFSKVWKTLEDLAPDYVVLHTGTSTDYDLNFESVFLVDEKGNYGIIWKENGKKIESLSRSPDSPFPLNFFLIDAASVPLEKAALLKLKQGDWGRSLRLTYRSSVEEYASFSPDGRYLVFSSDRIGGNRDIFMIDMANGTMKPIKLSGSSEYFPSISPDGSSILFQGSFTGNWAIYTIPINGNPRKIRRLAGSWKEAAYMPHWIDENNITYLQDKGDGNELCIEDVRTKKATKVSLPFRYVFSPRMCGGNLYFVGLKGADFGIYRLTKDGTVETVENSEYNEHDLDISSDCSSMVFVSNRDGVYRLWYKNLKNGSVKLVTDFIDYDVFYPEFSPDGKIVALSVYEPGIEPDIWLVRINVPEKTGGLHKEGKATEEGTETGLSSLGRH